jgi:hypothetical protein
VVSIKSLKHALCKILGFYGGEFEEWRLLGYDAVYLL